MEQKHTLELDGAAVFLSVSPRSLADERFRQRIGLPARRVGRKLVFTVRDCEAVLERGKEHFPGEARQ